MLLPFRMLFLLALPALLRADGLSDLRTRLQHLQGHTAVEADVQLATRQEVTALFRPVVSANSAHFQVQEDVSGLRIVWTPPSPATGDSDLGSLLGPLLEQPRTSAAEGLGSLLHQAAVLAHCTDVATFERESRAIHLGRSVRVLQFRCSPRIRPEHRGLAVTKEASLRIWIDEDGLPLGSESRLEYSGRHSRLYGRFHVQWTERTTFAVVQQRLVVASRTTEESSYDSGDRRKSRNDLTLAASAGAEVIPQPRS